MTQPIPINTIEVVPIGDRSGDGRRDRQGQSDFVMVVLKVGHRKDIYK
jgi:hypothetical protein